MAPRWLTRLRYKPRTRNDSARRGLPTKRLEPLDASAIQPGGCRWDWHSHQQCVARICHWPRGPARRRVRRLGVFAHALFPEEAHERGGAHVVVKGDGDVVRKRCWMITRRARAGSCMKAEKSSPSSCASARWDLMPPDRYMWVSGGNCPGLPEALLVLLGVEDRDGQRPRQRVGDDGRAGDRRVAAARLPLRHPGRRQLLYRDADGPRDGAARRQDPVRDAARLFGGTLRADGSGSRSCPTTWCSTPR